MSVIGRKHGRPKQRWLNRVENDANLIKVPIGEKQLKIEPFEEFSMSTKRNLAESLCQKCKISRSDS